MTITSSPDRRLRRPSSTSGSKTSQASGAPSSACRGADPRSVRGDATLPMGFTSKLVKLFSRSTWVRPGYVSSGGDFGQSILRDRAQRAAQLLDVGHEGIAHEAHVLNRT